MPIQSTRTAAPDLRVLSRESRGDGISSIPRPAFRWKTRLLLPGVILGGVAALFIYALQDTLLPAQTVRVIPVVVKASAAEGGATIVQAPGWVEADPYPLDATALADGIVRDVLVLEGQPVKANQIVARLIDDDARLTLAKAEAQLMQDESALTAAQTRWDNPIERRRDVDSAQAQVSQTKAELNQFEHEIAAQVAKADELREEVRVAEQAAKSNSATGLELIRAQKALEAQLAGVEAMRAKRSAVAAQLDRQSAELKAATEGFRLRIDERKALEEAKAAVRFSTALRDEAALRLARMNIRSPADGVVMTRLIQPGAKLVRDMDHPDSAVAMKIYDPERLQVRVDVPLADAAKIGVDQPAQIVVDVLPARTFAGKVTRIVNQADIQKNTLQVKVSITDPDPHLKPEMLARVKFEARAGGTSSTTTTSQTVFAPEHLLVRENDATRVWIVDAEKSIATFRNVQTGQTRQDGWIAILSGLSPGDLLIADPSGLRDGQRVRVVGEASQTKGADHGSH
jgi:RND family efflux transporter MFP subunit